VYLRATCVVTISSIIRMDVVSGRVASRGDAAIPENGASLRIDRCQRGGIEEHAFVCQRLPQPARALLSEGSRCLESALRTPAWLLDSALLPRATSRNIDDHHLGTERPSGGHPPISLVVSQFEFWCPNKKPAAPPATVPRTIHRSASPDRPTNGKVSQETNDGDIIPGVKTWTA
jgi:hypothetical protein